MASLTKEELVAKIASKITRYDASSPQAKLSLLQDLIIETLPSIKHGSSDYMQLMSVRCHQPAEIVIAWLDELMYVYLNLPTIKATLDHIEPAQRIKPY